MKFTYEADKLARYRAKRAVEVLNREVLPLSISDFAVLLSLLSLLFL
jgi:hypothetical protein